MAGEEIMSRSGVTGPFGKNTEKVQTMVSEAINTAITQVAARGCKPAQEDLRARIECLYLGHLLPLRAAMGVEANPFDPPEIDVDAGFKALASAAAVSEETMTAFVKSLFVRGLLHTPKLADFAASRNAAKEDGKETDGGVVQIRKEAA